MFGVAFLVVAVMHVTLYALSARRAGVLARCSSDRSGEPRRRALILVAGFVDGGWRLQLWLAALAVGFLGPFFVDVERLAACSRRTSSSGTA